MKFLILLFTITSFTAHAETVWEYVDKKLEKKEFKRWSLSSWLYDKEKFALQDQWLAMNLGDDSIFMEFYIDYSQTKFDIDTADNENIETTGNSSEVAAYIGFLGISYRFDKFSTQYEQTDTALNLRIIGSSHQATHLVLTYGERNLKATADDEDFTQSFYGGDISLYLLPFLGFDARYRQYNKAESNLGTLEMSSNKTTWGAFIDISFVRIFAYQFEENFEYTTLVDGSLSERQTKGTATGIRLYF